MISTVMKAKSDYFCLRVQLESHGLDLEHTSSTLMQMGSPLESSNAAITYSYYQ